MTATKKKPYVFEGSGSATADYFKPKQQLQTIVQGGKTESKGNWAFFKQDHPLAKTHKLIRSLCIQKRWSVPNEKWGEVADLERLSNFLKSDYSPVKKPLMDMDKEELEKIIVALNAIVVHHYNKKQK